MIRLAVARIKLFPQSLKTIFPFALLYLALLVAACGGAKQDSASESSTSSSAPASSTASSGASSAAGAFEGAITANLFADAQPMEMKYWIKGSRSRIETNLSRGGREMGVMLMDVTSGSQTMLIPQTKTYMTMNWGGDGAGLKEMAEKMGKTADDQPLKATSTGKTETIAGFSCEHWLMGERQDTDVCLAKGLGFFGGGGQSGGVFDKLKNLALGEKMKAQLDANPEFAKFVEGGAFPLKISQIENGQAKTVMEVTSVERKPLEDSLFTVPPDYKKMEIPGMPAGRK
ncbi:MAG: DUF4412 domain-containing protein [Acidobacteria bacterium]|nr:DUF4412 domain-containing protein [Acidobacteriota bacterium]